MQYNYSNHQMFREVVNKLSEQEIRQSVADRASIRQSTELATEADVQKLVAAFAARTQRRVPA